MLLLSRLLLRKQSSSNSAELKVPTGGVLNSYTSHCLHLQIGDEEAEGVPGAKANDARAGQRHDERPVTDDQEDASVPEGAIQILNPPSLG